MVWLPPPWVCLAFVFAFSTYVQDLREIAVLTAAAAIGR